jgi:hypothetical protein
MPSYDLATRSQVLTLKQNEFKNKDIHAQTTVSPSQIGAICRKAKELGWKVEDKGPILDICLERKEGSGRPLVLTPAKILEIVACVETDRYGSEKTSTQVAAQCKVSQKTVWRGLRLGGLRKTKPTIKPGLTVAMKEARYAWCKAREHWTLEDFKRVIWIDETSVVLGVRRGGRRVWRKANDSVAKRNVRPRWKGASEFMFWGSFSYNKKGPCYIWKIETAAEKKTSIATLKAMNAALEPSKKAEWELYTAMARVGLRNRPGPKPKWKFTKERGAFVRDGKKGGID